MKRKKKAGFFFTVTDKIEYNKYDSHKFLNESKIMAESVQYITNTQGERVGVLLNMETYQQLTNLSTDSELLIGLNEDELQALAETYLSVKNQLELDDLLVKNNENNLSNEERETLDRLIAQIDQLNILKTRARYTLKQLQNQSKVA